MKNTAIFQAYTSEVLRLANNTLAGVYGGHDVKMSLTELWQKTPEEDEEQKETADEVIARLRKGLESIGKENV